MAQILRKNFDDADETRPFEGGMGRLDVIQAEGGAIGRAVFEPGWRWSEHIKPLVSTDSCQAAHTGYVVSGRMKVVMDDGASEEYGPGDLMQIAPGHDAWVVGDERVVAVDWTGFGDYAKSSG